MGKQTKTGRTRPKRPGLETVKERHKRHKKEAATVTVDELRVVRKRGPKKERIVESEKKPTINRRLRSLLKSNEHIKRLQARRDQGETLDDQQLRKLARRDQILLQIDALTS